MVWGTREALFVRLRRASGGSRRKVEFRLPHSSLVCPPKMVEVDSCCGLVGHARCRGHGTFRNSRWGSG